jgi:hypothetical protein
MWNKKRWVDLRKRDHFKEEKTNEVFVVSYLDHADVGPGQRLIAFHALRQPDDNQSYRVIEMSNTEMVLVMDQRAAAAAAVDEVLRAVREDRGVE